MPRPMLDEPVTEAVITVPAYFNDLQRKATQNAGKLAGFEAPIADRAHGCGIGL